jgi:hypothetical protein
MVIVGGGAALTAIAVYLGFFAFKTVRASWRARARSQIAHREGGDDALVAREERERAQVSRGAKAA